MIEFQFKTGKTGQAEGHLRSLTQTLHDQSCKAGNLQSSQNHARGTLGSYLDWVQQAHVQLSNHLVEQQAADIVRTRYYWMLRQLTGDEPEVVPEVHAELRRQQVMLAGLKDEAQRIDEHWSGSHALVVPDTNFFLHHPIMFHAVDWLKVTSSRARGVRLVVPKVVVLELDRNKRSSNKQVKVRARHTLREFEARMTGDIHEPVIIQEGSKGLTDEPRPIGLEFMLEPLEHVRLDDADDEIVSRALYLQNLAGRPVSIATTDTTMLFNARSFDLLTHRMMDYDEVNEKDTEINSFSKT